MYRANDPTVLTKSSEKSVFHSDLGIIGLMICKKDTEVEVLEKGEAPLGSWRPARILSGNGHTYEVKYDSCVLEADVLRNKVPRKALRPRPPPVEVKGWACSDLVEVCEDGSWKIAEVLRTLDSNMVVARLLGSSKEIVSPLFQLRMPQIWKDNHWIPLQKESVKCKDLDVKTLSKKRNLSCQIPCLSVVEKKCKRVDRHAEKYDHSVDQWYQKSLGSLKKKSWECRSPVHPNSGALGKKKQIKKKGRCFELVEKNLTNQLFEKVDAVNSPQQFYGEKQMYSAFCHETVGFDQIGVYCKSPIANAGTNLIVSLDHLDNESTTSSVGSCSVFNGSCRPLYHKANQRQEVCGHNNDAESFCGSSTEPSHSREDDKAEAIHWLELDAYRSTLRLFYVSGSLSWEQESLLTNLRFALNISNDEHLSELKHLMLARS
ncbi:uncharacterized protein LOC110026848 isoform X2 [Phalaenopsis equestris]|uniref:uncharacterized protein LOC110026848 isoform X2 n=1 Tax=Phalaenopsis equestris TaxID=78828 RepID=UPI0009E1B071|nr:uncharacterized protein LOC110026848 isoform X2 [Phalaenopsis equestris]